MNGTWFVWITDTQLLLRRAVSWPCHPPIHPPPPVVSILLLKHTSVAFHCKSHISQRYLGRIRSKRLLSVGRMGVKDLRSLRFSVVSGGVISVVLKQLDFPLAYEVRLPFVSPLKAHVDVWLVVSKETGEEVTWLLLAEVSRASAAAWWSEHSLRGIFPRPDLRATATTAWTGRICNHKNIFLLY